MISNKKYNVCNRGDMDEIADSAIMTESDGAKIETPFNKKILNFFWFFIVFALIILLGRTFFLGVVKGEYYKEIANGNRIKNILVSAPRGKVYDRHGEVLAYNVPSTDLIAYPADFAGDDYKKKNLLDNIREILPEEKDEIFEKINNVSENSDPFIVSHNISQKEALLAMENQDNLPGIRVQQKAIREYADSLIFSHILGYESIVQKEDIENNPDYALTDSIGKRGLEKYYEKYLRGKHGKIKVEVNSMGEVVRELGIVSPYPGSDLILNIDAELQKKIFDSLSAVLEKNNLKAGAAVALDPKNGGVLAIVNVPSFDNNLFAKGITSKNYSRLLNNPDKPMFNRSISGEYPPGSTFKPIVAAGALKEGLIDEHTEIESKGGINVGSWFFGDWKTHGFTDMRRALAVSSDVYFYSIGGGYGNIEGLGIGGIKRYGELFGIGETTGIDLPGEADGFLPTPAWKKEKIGERWYVGNTYHASIGQGYITTTPLQIANSVSAIANNGTLYQPQIVSHIKKGDNVVNNKSEIIRENFLDKNILKIIREGMRETITEGTAKQLSDLPVEVAGKTGTAQYGTKDKTYGWFASFAPFDDPEIVIVVLVEGQEEETYNAVPVTKEVYEWYFDENNN
jgi:penicillin-binding protein 2